MRSPTNCPSNCATRAEPWSGQTRGRFTKSGRAENGWHPTDPTAAGHKPAHSVVERIEPAGEIRYRAPANRHTWYSTGRLDSRLTSVTVHNPSRPDLRTDRRRPHPAQRRTNPEPPSPPSCASPAGHSAAPSTPRPPKPATGCQRLTAADHPRADRGTTRCFLSLLTTTGRGFASPGRQGDRSWATGDCYAQIWDSREVRLLPATRPEVEPAIPRG